VLGLEQFPLHTTSEFAIDIDCDIVPHLLKASVVICSLSSSCFFFYLISFAVVHYEFILVLSETRIHTPVYWPFPR